MRNFLVYIPYRRSSLGMAYVRLLGKIYPNFVVRSKEQPHVYILYLCVQSWRVYLICFFCLCLLWAKRFFWFWVRCAKRFFSFWRELFVSFHSKIYDNGFTYFLFVRLRPLSFSQFTFMLGFFLAFGWVLWREALLLYANFFALAVFFNINIT